MKKKLIVSILLIFIIIILSFNSVNAQVLELNIESSKEKIKVGEEFEIKIDWKEDMQASDFSLYFDNEKIKFLETDLDEAFIQEKQNCIKVAWFSTKNENKTNIIFKFKAIEEGEFEFKIKVDGGFATGALRKPDRYKTEHLKIQINTSYSLLKIITVLIIILILIYLLISKKQRRKK